FVPYGLHGLALGYLVSGASLGAAAGAICAGPLADRFGRKWLLITDAGIYAADAILSAVTPDVGVMLLARTLIGVAIGRTRRSPPPTSPSTRRRTGAARWRCCSSG
ncbi:MAG TPA: MFS transporter, partial [Streptosporangiaceae bacterium]